MSPQTSVVSVGIDDGPGPLAGSDVVFLPITSDGDTPIYSGEVPELMAALQAADVSSRTWDPAGTAEFVAYRGPITDTLIQIAVGIASSGGWQAIQSLLERRRGTVRVIAVYERGGERFRLEVTGPPDQVAKELQRLDPFRPESPA